MAGKFEIKKSASGSFRFNLKSGNQETILSSETYQTKEEARNGAESVKRNAADDSRYERKTSTGGQSYFVLKAANQEVIGTSETYSSQSAMENGIQAVKTNAPSAGIVDATGV
ncbi:MAG: YegP family protein [Acidobacteria bacterium]|nr:YegP family protein [Acidobacteriota bacterium]